MPLEKIADWITCPNCDGQICKKCQNSGNPGYILVRRK